uniref:Uncharacterized protein n=1 Tax=Romanomermis culicivorax TaxID=13658 RepID=A0A915JMV6_ROMCU
MPLLLAPSYVAFIYIQGFSMGHGLVCCGRGRPGCHFAKKFESGWKMQLLRVKSARGVERVDGFGHLRTKSGLFFYKKPYSTDRYYNDRLLCLWIDQYDHNTINEDKRQGKE